ncbi:MAG: hypothetical protein WCF04_14550 [Candidatus Nanopelagicales bacterium]
MFVDLSLCAGCGVMLGHWPPPLRMCPYCERVTRAAADREARP